MIQTPAQLRLQLRPPQFKPLQLRPSQIRPSRPRPPNSNPLNIQTPIGSELFGNVYVIQNMHGIYK